LRQLKKDVVVVASKWCMVVLLMRMNGVVVMEGKDGNGW